MSELKIIKIAYLFGNSENYLERKVEKTEYHRGRASPYYLIHTKPECGERHNLFLVYEGQINYSGWINIYPISGFQKAYSNGVAIDHPVHCEPYYGYVYTEEL